MSARAADATSIALIALAICTLTPDRAWAQPAEGAPAASGDEAPDGSVDSEAEPTPEPLEVTIIGTQADDLRRMPGSGTRIGPRDLSDFSPGQTGDALELAPGVVARQSASGGNRLDLTIRGLDAPRGRRVLILEDGVPQAVNPYGEPEMYYTPSLSRVRSIEVLHGAAGLMFGPQTVGGVINFRTHAPPTRPTAHIALKGGLPTYAGIVGRYGDQIGNGDAAYLVHVEHEGGDGFREEPFVDTDAYAKIRLNPSPRDEIIVKLSGHVERRINGQVGLTRDMFEMDPQQPTLTPHDLMEIERYGLDVLFRHAISEDVSVRVLTFGSITSRLWTNQLYDRAPQDGIEYLRVVGNPGLLNGAIYFRDEDRIIDRSYRGVGLEPQLQARFQTGALDHELTVGVRGMYETSQRSDRRGQDVNTIAGEIQSLETGETMAGAAFIVDEAAPTDWLLARVGLRFEAASMNRDIERAFVDNVPADVDIRGETTITELLPGAGLVVGDQTFHAFGGAHTGFAPPRRTTAIRSDGVDQLLDPERSIHYEAGFRSEPLKGLDVSATGYFIHFTNQVVPDTSGQEGALASIGRTRHGGVELAADAQTKDLAGTGLEPHLALRYTYGRAELVDGTFAGNDLPYAPRQKGMGQLSIRHSTGISVRGGVRVIGEQFTDDANTVLPDASGRVGVIDTYALLSAGVGYVNQTTGLSIDLSMQNITDAGYVNLRRPDGIASGPPRSVWLRLAWDYVADPTPPTF